MRAVQVSQGEELYAACTRVEAGKKEFLRLPDAGHNDLLLTHRDEYFAAVARVVAAVDPAAAAGSGSGSAGGAASADSSDKGCNCL